VPYGLPRFCYLPEIVSISFYAFLVIALVKAGMDFVFCPGGFALESRYSTFDLFISLVVCRIILPTAPSVF
jgi:hypothetical protein